MSSAMKASSTLVDSALRSNAHLEDFGVFVVCLWYALNLPVPSDIQIDIAKYLHHGPRRRMVKAFRGVGKSWLTAAYVLWRLLGDCNLRVLVVSAANDRAMGFTRFVRRLINEIPWLQHLEPRRGQADSVLMFDVAGAEPHQSNSVRAASITGQLAGSRAHLIIADDIEIPRNSQTVKMRDQLASQVTEFDAILIPGGEVIYLGTDQTEMSLYRQLPARGYDVRIWPARVPRPDKVPAYGSALAPALRQMLQGGAKALTPTDPQRFDDADLLEREASYGRSGFAMQFMLDPSMGDAERFPLRCSDFMVLDVQPTLVPTQVVWGSDPKLQVIQDIECPGLVGDRWHRPMFVGPKWSPPDETVMFIDPSGRGADETAAAVACNFGPTVFVLGVRGWMDGYAESTLKGIVDMARELGVTRVRVEPNFGGGMYTNILQGAFSKHGYPCTIEDAEYARSQKEARIIDELEPMLVQHRVVVTTRVIAEDLQVLKKRADSVGEDRASEYRLFHQLTRLTRDRDSLRHDDRIEALAGAVHYFVGGQIQSQADAHEAHLESLRDAEIEKFLVEVAGAQPAGNLWTEVR